MSELNVIDVDKMADVRSLSGQFYRKSEADKVIAGLKEGAKNLILDNYLKDQEIKHHKYKRCLAMASNCRLRARWFGDNAFYKKEQWALQWHRRWLKLAEKFKEAK